MVVVELIRLIIVLATTAGGYRIGQALPHQVPLARYDPETWSLLGAIVGAGVGYVTGGMLGRSLLRGIGSVERRIDRIGGTELVTGAVGLLAGALAAAILSWLAVLFLPFPFVRYPFIAVAFIVLGYAGTRLALHKRFDLLQMLGLASARPLSPLSPLQPPSPQSGPHVLDTSAIIDGRIIDVVKAGFLAGRVVCPGFVVGELTGIADSGDPVRRARGRRGLEVLEVLRANPRIALEVVDDTIPEIVEVDAKLVTLARRLSGALVTTDYNLHRAAELQGIAVLNLNNLAAALRPSALPGEHLTVAVIKAGNQPGQGVGYLDDGTMVVIEGGQKLTGNEVEVTITSVMQTSVGRMIFSTVGHAPAPPAAESRPSGSRRARQAPAERRPPSPE
ncbi:MAG TPA: TRAM domain-containing protein [Actinomycetota bacterium]|jgi:uncharacterized protein YacL